MILFLLRFMIIIIAVRCIRSLTMTMIRMPAAVLPVPARKIKTVTIAAGTVLTTAGHIQGHIEINLRGKIRGQTIRIIQIRPGQTLRDHRLVQGPGILPASQNMRMP